jgi:antitoxin component HigA of HigAB toxin-antitoxin module
MSLAEHIAQLRQLAAEDPETSLLDLAIINLLAELVEAVEELRGGEPPRGVGSV